MTWQLRARPEDSTNALVARSTAVCRRGAGPSSATNEHGLTARPDGLLTGVFPMQRCAPVQRSARNSAVG